MTSAPPPPLARFDAVTHRYGDTFALKDVTLALPAGRTLGLIGPDGVGKSTLLALLSGVRKLQSGRLQVMGADFSVGRQRRQTQARIAYMPQGLGRNLYPTLSIIENITYFADLSGLTPAERRARMQPLLEATGLDPFADRPAGKLSGGMKQKLGLCCALVREPDLLILDEPTTGVDPLSRRQFWQLIADLKTRRPEMSVVVATAYMEEAEQFDWLAAMNAGEILAAGTPAELLDLTGASDIDEAFIRLLPEERRSRHHPVVLPPRAAADGPPAIEASDLTRRFGDFVAVDAVNFRIERGEIFGFLGSNGCGKTTTMKMLTGLLPPSAGTAKLFGKEPNPRDLETRRRIGYMSQSFSLYGELSVRQNLHLHARLFGLGEASAARVETLLDQFDLRAHAEANPESLPLGIRQRLQLAVAVLHEPEILILDEPTSGVDPIARDGFWRHLISLSRDDGVTIFISTHFMHEAERCDRISFMHRGRVLAVDTPDNLAAGADGSLEEAFVSYLQTASEPTPTHSLQPAAPASSAITTEATASKGATPIPTDDEAMRARAPVRGFSPQRLNAGVMREIREVIRDPIRIAFAIGGPLILLLTFGYGVTFDVENLRFAVLDQDRSALSRDFVQGFSASSYFQEEPPIVSNTEARNRLASGELAFAVLIPAEFGKDLLRGREPQITVLIDGAATFRAETARGYVEGVTGRQVEQWVRDGTLSTPAVLPAQIVPRFRYNQAFESISAIVPSVITILMILIPAMMTAVGIVREKETGSITNFRTTPVTRTEFLLGKVLPYTALAFVSFLTVLAFAVFLFGLPIKGSPVALLAGGLLYAFAATAFGAVMSSFMRSQVAAIFATAIITLIPTVSFSGFLIPISSLDPGGRLFGQLFPAAWFQPISLGTFSKALGVTELWPNLAMLAFYGVLYVTLSRFGLRKQER